MMNNSNLIDVYRECHIRTIIMLVALFKINFTKICNDIVLLMVQKVVYLLTMSFTIHCEINVLGMVLFWLFLTKI